MLSLKSGRLRVVFLQQLNFQEVTIYGKQLVNNLIITLTTKIKILKVFMQTGLNFS